VANKRILGGAHTHFGTTTEINHFLSLTYRSAKGHQAYLGWLGC